MDTAVQLIPATVQCSYNKAPAGLEKADHTIVHRLVHSNKISCSSTG